MSDDSETPLERRSRLRRETLVRIIDGRDLSHQDMLQVEIVAGVIAQIHEAQALLADQGLTIADGTEQNPLVEVEKKLSLEVRGWIERRPDLFGQHKAPGRHSTTTRKERFRVVTGTDVATR
ncbi:hypothetical protein [Ancrocorticia populi]|uniref:hypothetical protein n=1 Tax=Ancrocorticia populi TaxID=2175228 RepID=UPI003F9D3297